jgi:hypothetical protein
MSDHMYIEDYMAYAHQLSILSLFSAWWPLASRGRRIYIYIYIYYYHHYYYDYDDSLILGTMCD